MTAAHLDVVVPTYRRPEQLRACLRALGAQRQRPGVVVVHRVGDDDSAAVVAEFPFVRSVLVSEPGVLAAMRRGVSATSAPLVAFTDDDAEPHHDWASRLVDLLLMPGVGAAGGRDIVAHDQRSDKDVVGRLSWFGRATGNHHRGTGGAREVDFLKGVNMGFRSDCLALPRRGLLRGQGAEVHYEMLTCRAVRKGGFRVIYDAQLLVDHVAAPRHDDDARGRPARTAIKNAAFNRVVASYALDPAWRWQWMYLLLFGEWGSPGLGRAAVAAVRREREVLRRTLPSIAGLITGMTAIARGECEDPLVSAMKLRKGEVT